MYSSQKINGEDGIGYVDADFARNVDTRKSFTCLVFTMLSITVSLKANLQHFIALLTTKTEYIAITKAIKEAMGHSGMVNELSVGCTIVF